MKTVFYTWLSSVSCGIKLGGWIQMSVGETFFIQVYPVSAAQNAYEY